MLNLCWILYWIFYAIFDCSKAHLLLTWVIRMVQCVCVGGCMCINARSVDLHAIVAPFPSQKRNHKMGFGETFHPCLTASNNSTKCGCSDPRNAASGKPVVLILAAPASRQVCSGLCPALNVVLLNSMVCTFVPPFPFMVSFRWWSAWMSEPVFFLFCFLKSNLKCTDISLISKWSLSGWLTSSCSFACGFSLFWSLLGVLCGGDVCMLWYKLATILNDQAWTFCLFKPAVWW